MKSIIKLKLLLVLLVFLFSCNEKSIDNKGSENLLLSISPYLTDISDAALAFYSYDSYLRNDLNTEDYYVKNYSGYFTNRSNFINIGSIEADNRVLVPRSGYSGHYTMSDFKMSTHPSNNQISWKINGFLGDTGTVIQNIPSRLRIDSSIKINNYTKSSGLSISYSGSTGIGDLRVDLFVDNFINSATGINISSDPPVEYYLFTKPNNGNLTLTSTDLSALIPNRYYQLKITQTNIETVPFGNKLISLLSQTATSSYFYLSN